jgi:hypothetical protein
MLRAVLATAIAVMIAAPAMAQTPAVAPAPEVSTSLTPADKHLWCASAFYWLAGSAEDSGDAEEAEMYDRWSKRLLDMAGSTLTSEGLKPEEIEALVASYDEKVLVDLAGTAPPHDIITCPQLLGEFR